MSEFDEEKAKAFAKVRAAEKQSSVLSSERIVDFDKLSAEPRIAIVGGERINVSLIPTRQTLKIARFYDDSQSGKMATEEALERIVEIVGDICSRDNPKVTSDFLLDHLAFKALREFVTFILEPLEEVAEAGEAEAAKSE